MKQALVIPLVLALAGCGVGPLSLDLGSAFSDSLSAQAKKKKKPAPKKSSYKDRYVKVMVAVLDANADGQVDPSEFSKNARWMKGESKSAIKAAFDAMDTDEDGTLTPEEIAASVKSSIDRAAYQKFLFVVLDSNGDRAITYAEYTKNAVWLKGTSKSELKQLFDATDADGDGKLTAEELNASTTDAL